MVVGLSGPDARSLDRSGLPAEHLAARSRVSRGRSRGSCGPWWREICFRRPRKLFGDFAQTQRSANTATFRRSSSQIESGNVGLRNLSNWRLGAGLAWELDFWGRFRRAIEAADARLNSSVENYDDALVLLIAEVATAYVDYRTVDQRLTFARGNAEMQKESTRIAEARLKVVAIDSEIDAPQAKSNLARTLAAIEALEIARRQSENRLCVLLGMPPQDLERSSGRDEAGSRRSGECGSWHSGRTAATQARCAPCRAVGRRIECRYRCRPIQSLSAYCLERCDGI